MLSPQRLRQRRIDTLCGYALGAYASITLTWILLLLGSSSLAFAFFGGVAISFFGSLRGIAMPLRFWIVPVVSLVYTAAAFVLLHYRQPLAAAAIGILFTAGLGYVVFDLFRNHFAKTTPAWQCKDCGYALLGLTTTSCPECGHAFDPRLVPRVDGEGKPLGGEERDV